MEAIRRAVEASYGLRVSAIQRASGGWTADAYLLRADGAEYFVKAYDKGRPSVRPWIARMDLYLPVTFWLYEHTPLRDWMIVPLRTTDGQYKAEGAQRVLLVYPLLKGVTIGAARLDVRQVRQLAAAVAALHAQEWGRSGAADALREEYALPFLPELTALADGGGQPAVLGDLLRPHLGSIRQGAELLQELAMSLRRSDARQVLCHTDLHGWNLMWNDHLVLLDWEGLRLAPPEADLFAFSDGFFFDYAREAFMTAYRRGREGYAVNERAMLFYRLRRRLEDLAELAFSIGGDALSAAEADATLQHLRRECAALERML